MAPVVTTKNYIKNYIEYSTLIIKLGLYTDPSVRVRRKKVPRKRTTGMWVKFDILQTTLGKSRFRYRVVSDLVVFKLYSHRLNPLTNIFHVS